MNFIKNKYNIDFDTDEKINQFKILEEQYLLKNSVELKKGLIQLLKYLNIHYYIKNPLISILPGVQRYIINNSLI